MKVFWLIVTAFIALIVVIPMAWAEKYYFYKEVGKQIPKGQRYDYHVIDLGKRIKDGCGLTIPLPKKYANNSDEVDFSFHFGVNPDMADSDSYWVFLDKIAIRDDKNQYHLDPSGPDPAKLMPEAEKNLGENFVRRMRQNYSDGGIIRSRYEISIEKGNALGLQLSFRAPTLPKILNLDYKFRIRKEGGSTEVFEGTIPLELASYNVGWWEKTRW